MAKKVKLNISSRLLRKKNRKSSFNINKHCKFCSNDQAELSLDYKNSPLLKFFITERGKILPSRISGTCAKHQRVVNCEIKKARSMALLSYTANNF